MEPITLGWIVGIITMIIFEIIVIKMDWHDGFLLFLIINFTGALGSFAMGLMACLIHETPGVWIKVLYFIIVLAIFVIIKYGIYLLSKNKPWEKIKWNR